MSSGRYILIFPSGVSKVIVRSPPVVLVVTEIFPSANTLSEIKAMFIKEKRRGTTKEII